MFFFLKNEALIYLLSFVSDFHCWNTRKFYRQMGFSHTNYHSSLLAQVLLRAGTAT